MEGFKKQPKMQCFKEGGSVKYESRKQHKEEMSADIAQDKKIVKKAFKIHDEQSHEGKKTDLSKLKKGGRAKKDCGTVRKYKTGGTVENQYGAKKTEKDIKDIANTKRQKAKKLCGGGKAYADGGIVETLKEQATDIKNKILGTPEQNRIAQANLDKQAAQGSKLAKILGGSVSDKDYSQKGAMSDKDASFNKKRGGKVC